MSKDNINTSLFLEIVFFVFCLFIIFLNKRIETSYYVSYLILIMSIFGAIRARKNWGQFIIYGFILWCNYSICVANFISPINNFFTGFKSDNVMILATNVLFLFTSIIVLFMPKVPKQKSSFFENNRNNSLISAGCIIAMAFFLLLTIIKNSNNDGRLSTNSFYEYSIIFAIIGFYFSGNNKITRRIIIFLCLMYITFDLCGGNRALSIQMIIMLFLITYSHKAKFRIVLPFALLGAALLLFVGTYRNSNGLSFSGISHVIQDSVHSKFLFDTSYSAFFTSCTFLKTEQLVSLTVRINLFFKFALSMIFGGNFIDGSNLPAFTHDYYTHYYGGVLPYYFHFYLGYFGVFIISLYVIFLQKKLFNDSNSGIKKCIMVYFVCSVSRWYLYSPSSIIRGILLISLVYFICGFVRQKNRNRSLCVNITKQFEQV